MWMLTLILFLLRPLESFAFLGTFNNKLCNHQGNIKGCYSNIHEKLKRKSYRSDFMKRHEQSSDMLDVSSPHKKSLFQLDLLTKVCQNLWFLPLLSILSGLSPAVKIIAQAHISRMPDNVIAHDIDTLLLWPAIADEHGIVSLKVFTAPDAAVTDPSLYNVDWGLVQNTYFNEVSHSLLWSMILSLSLHLYLILNDGSDTSDINKI